MIPVCGRSEKGVKFLYYTSDTSGDKWRWVTDSILRKQKESEDNSTVLSYPGEIEEIREVGTIKIYMIETSGINFRIKVIYDPENKLREICIEQDPKKIYITPEHIKAILKVLIHEDQIDDFLKEISKDVMT